MTVRRPGQPQRHARQRRADHREVPLKDGDELRVGPLKFRVAEAESKAGGSRPKSAIAASPKNDKPRKQPPVKDVADVVERTISNLGQCDRR